MMPPPKRARLPSRRHASIAAATDTRGRSRGWLSDVRRDPSKQPRRDDEDDGTPLADEILLVIFAGVPEIADLVRCAATCRRWRRLVSGEAAFICRTSRRLAGSGGGFVPPLALGFFHHKDPAAAARFVPTASASRRFPGLREPSPPPSLSTLFAGEGLRLDSSSRVVASRNGLVVVDLRRGGGGKHGRALKLCVCNPMTGEVHVLPPLRGKDGLGHYACTVLTAGDHLATDPPPRSPSSYRLLLVYSRRGFTAFRSYSSDDGTWSPEAKVTGAQLGARKMALARNGVVAPGGRAVYWVAKDTVFGLRLDTLEASVLGGQQQRMYDIDDDTRLGFTPEGKLCAVQLNRWVIDLATLRGRVEIRILTYGVQGEFWGMEEQIWMESFSSMDNVMTLKLLWFYERSGVVLFNAGRSLGGGWMNEVYAFSIHERTVEKVASNGDAVNDPWGNIHGYEMDQATYLTSLAEPGSRMMEDMG